MITIRERAAVERRANAAMRHLHAHPATTVDQLGAARTQLNISRTHTNHLKVWDAVQELEDIVLHVYGQIPPTDPTA